MKKKTGCFSIALALTSAAANAQESNWGDELARAVSDGKASLDLRYRYEHVDQESFDRNANAGTLRSRLSLTTGSMRGFTAMLEVDDVSALGADGYNSTKNGQAQYPVIADPEGTGVNQAWLKWSGENADATYGRQRILHGNQRFIGGVAWRQNEQTYDGFRGTWKSGSDALKADIAYVYNVERIFGPDDGVNPAQLRGDNLFFRADYTIAKGHTLSGYAYSMEFDPQRDYDSGKAEDNSNETFGAQYSGKFGGVSLQAALATQSDAGDSTLDYSARYYQLEAATTLKTVGLKAGLEVLGGDDGVGFKTPLATLHKFQGWADVFLATPGDGIEDLYLGISGELGPVKLAANYHDFQAEDSSEDFGNEWDFVATWQVVKQFSIEAKYATFESDTDRYSDVDKAWVTLQLKL